MDLQERSKVDNLMFIYTEYAFVDGYGVRTAGELHEEFVVREISTRHEMEMVTEEALVG